MARDRHASCLQRGRDQKRVCACRVALGDEVVAWGGGDDANDDGSETVHRVRVSRRRDDADGSGSCINAWDMVI